MRSMKALPSSKCSHCGSTAQVRCDLGWLCLSEATAGRLLTMSPIAPSRTTRMRLLAGLPPLNMLPQLPGAALVGGFQAHQLGRFKRLDQAVQIAIVRGHHVVYHAQRGHQLGAGTGIEHGPESGEDRKST